MKTLQKNNPKKQTQKVSENETQTKEVVKATPVKVVKNKTSSVIPPQILREKEIPDIMKKIDKLARLKNSYAVLSSKSKDIKQAVVRMEQFLDKNQVDFVSGQENEDFPYRIILEKKDERYDDRWETSFLLKKEKVVLEFTKILDKEISQLLDLFTVDMDDYFKRLNQK